MCACVCVSVCDLTKSYEFDFLLADVGKPKCPGVCTWGRLKRGQGFLSSIFAISGQTPGQEKSVGIVPRNHNFSYIDHIAGSWGFSPTTQRCELYTNSYDLGTIPAGF